LGTVAENMGDRLGQAIRQKPGSRRSQLVLDYTNGLSTGSKTALTTGKSVRHRSTIGLRVPTGIDDRVRADRERVPPHH